MNIPDSPTVKEMKEMQVVNGSTFSFACPFISGNPSFTTFLWRRASDNTTWTSQILSLESANYLTDDTYFICTAYNTMGPTTGLPEHGISNGLLHMIVLCKCIQMFDLLIV